MLAHLPPWPLLILWAAWFVQALLSMVAVRKFRDGFGRRHRPDFDDYRPSAAVIVPFKGRDTQLESGVQSLFEQDYPTYQLMLVVESDLDPAYPVLQSAIEKHPNIKATIIQAGACGPHEGQKIHNQLAAIDRLSDMHTDDGPKPDVWVFADSDAAPGPDWLADMVGPLCRPRIGATTGYRWMVPVADGLRTRLWSAMASVMNSSIACLMGKDTRNHAWGGSMAMRAETARTGRLRELFAGALSDDYQVTYMCQQLGLRVYFVRSALVASPTSFKLRTLAEFVRRQYVITRLHAPRLFAIGLGLTSLYVAGTLSCLWWIGASLAGMTAPYSWAWALLAGLGVHVTNQRRSSLRRQVVQKAFDEAIENQLASTLRLDRWGTSIWMGLHWVLIVSAMAGRTLSWRNIRYRINGRQNIQRLSPSPERPD